MIGMGAGVLAVIIVGVLTAGCGANDDGTTNRPLPPVSVQRAGVDGSVITASVADQAAPPTFGDSATTTTPALGADAGSTPNATPANDSRPTAPPTTRAPLATAPPPTFSPATVSSNTSPAATFPPATIAPGSNRCPLTDHDPTKVAACGDSTRLVVSVQTWLVCIGYDVTPDGTFGIGTYDAVVAFQRSAGLSADGLAGSRTQGALDTACRTSS